MYSVVFLQTVPHKCLAVRFRLYLIKNKREICISQQLKQTDNAETLTSLGELEILYISIFHPLILSFRTDVIINSGNHNNTVKSFLGQHSTLFN